MAKKIEVQIVGDSDSLHRALGKAGDSTSRFGRIATGIGKAGFLALGAGAVVAGAGIVKAVQAGSDWNETLNKSNVIFGRSSDTVTKWAGTMAEAGGVSEQAALDSASMFGTFGKSAGVAQKDLAGWSESLVQAASDMASFHNADPTQVLEDIRSGLAGEVEPLRKYGILMNDAALRTQAMKMGLVSTTKDALSPANKMLAAQALILKDLGPAAGDFARTSGGLANQQRIMKAELQNVVTELGTALLPIVLKIAQFAAPLLIGALKFIGRVTTSWGQTINHVSGQVGGFQNRIGKFVSAVVAWFRGNVMPVVRQLQHVFQDAFAAIARVVQQHGAELGRIADRIGAALKAVAKVAVPILRFALVKVLPQALAVAIRAIDLVSAAIATLVNWIITAVNEFKSLASTAKSVLSTSGIDIIRGIAGGSGFGNSVARGGAATGSGSGVTQVNLHLDGKVFYSAIVNQDKIAKRQTGRSLLASG